MPITRLKCSPPKHFTFVFMNVRFIDNGWMDDGYLNDRNATYVYEHGTPNLLSLIIHTYYCKPFAKVT